MLRPLLQCKSVAEVTAMSALALNESVLLDRPLNFPRTATCSSAQPELEDANLSVEGCLIRRVLGGDHEAFDGLVRPYERMIFVSALAIVGNEADAEEVAQEAVLKAFRALPRFRQESKFSTWLTQIVINEAKMRLRKDRRHLYESLDEGIHSDEGDYIPRDFADWREIPSEALENRELRGMLQNALESLPAKYRSVLVMRDVQHLSIRETAELLGISEANVKTRLCRARLQMRDALAPALGRQA
jgi:RNA polymerase sigma-70 factor (ECF subfamily)